MFRLLAAGLGTKAITETLLVRTVMARTHISRLIASPGVENRLQAVVYASNRDLIRPSPHLLTPGTMLAGRMNDTNLPESE